MRGQAYLGVLVLVGILLILPLWVVAARPADDFFDTRVVVDRGASLHEIADVLKTEGVIRYSFPFKALVALSGKAAGIRAGTYVFKRPTNLYHIATRMVTGDFGIETVRIVVFEGDTRADMPRRFARHLGQFDAERFLALTEQDEGRLFPDTYFFFETDTTEQVVEALGSAFQKRVDWVEEDILVMASIIEKEAPAGLRDKRLISGILWKRLKNDMLLQVDAPFAYAIGKNTFQLSLDDLKIDSPYNTYLDKGWPPTPIASPGLGAIEAARDPLESDFWYYLSDRRGNMYYAETFEGHKINKARYLR